MNAELHRLEGIDSIAHHLAEIHYSNDIRSRLMTYLAIGYLIYVCLTVGITVVVGQTLHRHGRIFLLDVFHGHVTPADAVNHLLLVGFYLTNVAFGLFMLRTNTSAADWIDVATFLSDKLGIVLTVLGIMHFLNVAVLAKVRQLTATRDVGPLA